MNSILAVSVLAFHSPILPATPEAASVLALSNTLNCQLVDQFGNTVCVEVIQGLVQAHVKVAPCGDITTATSTTVPGSTRRRVASDCYDGLEWLVQPESGETWLTTDCGTLDITAVYCEE